MLIYLGFSALAVFLTSFVLVLLGDPGLFTLTHLVFALAILPLIFGAITHFVPVLTRSGGAQQGVLLMPLLLQLTGFLVFLFFSGAVEMPLLYVAAGIALLVTLGFAGWLIARARYTLGKPHPGWRWYLAAIVFLAIALGLVPAMDVWPAWRPQFRLLHLHLNTLGFVGLTAIGTLQVLLPTVLSGPDAEAAIRLRRDLPWAVAGVLAIGLGAAFWKLLSCFGAGLLLLVACRLGLAWWRQYGWRTIAADGASAALATALCGFLLILVFGMLHAFGWVDGHDAVAAFTVMFLLPLVSGALSQLLPVWRHPGRRTPVRDRMRTVLVGGGAVRALLFSSGGILLALGYREGLWLGAFGLLSFLFVVIRAFAFTHQQET